MKKSRKVSFRVAPPVNQGLALLAQCSETTVADFIRGCVSYALTAEREHLPDFLKDGQHYNAVNDVNGWRTLLDEL